LSHSFADRCNSGGADLPKGERSSAHTAALAILGREAIAETGTDGFLAAAAAIIAKAADVVDCGIFLRQASSRHLLLGAGVGCLEAGAGKTQLSAGARSHLGQALARAQVLQVDDLAAQASGRTLRLIHGQGLRSALLAPLPGPRAPQGVVALYHRQPSAFDQVHRDFLATAGTLLAAGLDRRRAKAPLDEMAEAAGPDGATLQELRHRLTRLEVAVRGSSDGLWDAALKPGRPWHDPHSPVWYSARFKQLLGYGEHELEPVLDTWTRRWHPEEREAVLEALTQHLRQRVPFDAEHRLLTRSGEYRWFRIRGEALWDAEGQPIRMAGTLQDITDRKAMEDSIESYVRYLEAMHQISEVIDQAQDIGTLVREAVRRLRLIFDADRAWLLYPCDPDSPWAVPVEDTRQQYPGVSSLACERLPMDASAAEVVRAALEAKEAVAYGPEHPFPKDAPWKEHFSIQSQLNIALHPRSGKAWLLGLHQCAFPRIWSPGERQLFRDIARRLTDALSHLLLYHDLEQSEARYRALFQSSMDGIYVTTPHGQFIDVNPALCRILGYPSPERFLVTDSEHQRYFRQLHAAHCASQTSSLHVHLARTDGAKLWAEARVQPVTDAAGAIAYYQGIIRDVTEAKHQEDMLRESETKFRALAETVPASICFQLGRRVLYANSAASALTGYSAEELQAVDFMDIVHPRFRDLVRDAEQRAERGVDSSSRHEIQIVTKSGEPRWLEFMVGSIEYAGQRAVLRTAFDVTERKRAESEMARLLEENRTLARQCMRIQEDERRSLAHDLHDELGQCLSAIRADAASICKRSADSDARIHESAQAIVTVANHVQEVTRSMMRRLRPSSLNTLGLAETLRATVSDWQQHRNIPCHLLVQGEVDGLGDTVAIHIYRIVQESLTNVAKHAKARRVEVALLRSARPPPNWSEGAIAAAGRLAGSEAIYLSVSDDGRGIVATMPRKGLGLLGNRERVSALGGFLHVHSEVGKGTCIAVGIPVPPTVREAPCPSP
jgi:PAS domain S-box-containing protein